MKVIAIYTLLLHQETTLESCHEYPTFQTFSEPNNSDCMEETISDSRTLVVPRIDSGVQEVTVRVVARNAKE